MKIVLLLLNFNFILVDDELCHLQKNQKFSQKFNQYLYIPTNYSNL